MFKLMPDLENLFLIKTLIKMMFWGLKDVKMELFFHVFLLVEKVILDKDRNTYEFEFGDTQSILLRRIKASKQP